MTFKIGDKVKIKPYNTIKYWYEEVKPEEIHTISEICVTKTKKPYVQLKEVYSSYPFEMLILVEKIFKEN